MGTASTPRWRPQAKPPCAGKRDRGGLRRYGITYYPKGVCYYTYWIKHADDGDDTAFGTMEYAIVRNNLYQLTVTSVSGIGDPQPGDSELTIEVAVRNWQAMDEENVDLQ